MRRLSSFIVGVIALDILRYKYSLPNAGGFKPSEFQQWTIENAKRIGCSQERFVKFFRDFLLPEILRGCKLNNEPPLPTPYREDGAIAFSLLKARFFWDLRGLRDEVSRIANKTEHPFEDVAAVVLYIAKCHLDEQFAEGDAIKLEIFNEWGSP